MQFTDRQAMSYLLLASGETDSFGRPASLVAAIEGLPAADRGPVFSLFAAAVREVLPFDIDRAIAAATT